MKLVAVMGALGIGALLVLLGLKQKKTVSVGRDHYLQVRELGAQLIGVVTCA